MDWNRDNKKCSKRAWCNYLILFGFTLGVGIPTTSQAMNYVFSIISGGAGLLSTKPVKQLTEKAVSYFEIEETQGDLFNEAVASRDREKMESTVLDVLDVIRENLKTKGYNSNKTLHDKLESDSIVNKYCNAFYVWHSRYRVASLILDYIDAFRKECDDATKFIKKYIPDENDSIVGMKSLKEQNQKLQSQQNILYFQKYLDEIAEKRLDAGSHLYNRYRYTRGGGILERSNKSYVAKNTRFDDWGVQSFSEPSFSLTPECLFNISSKKLKVEDEIINRIRGAYLATLEILTLHEAVTLKKIKYFETLFQEIFPKHQLTPYKITGIIFEEEDKSNGKKELELLETVNEEVDNQLEEEKEKLVIKRSLPINIPDIKNKKLYQKEKGSYGISNENIAFSFEEDRQTIFGKMSFEETFEEKKGEGKRRLESNNSLEEEEEN
jgi:hypothetical protein